MDIFEGAHTEGMGVLGCSGSCLIIIVFCLHNIWGAALPLCVYFADKHAQLCPCGPTAAPQSPPPTHPTPSPNPHQMLQEPTPSSAGNRWKVE